MAYGEEKIVEPILKSIYYVIVRRSFGYGKKLTNRIKQEELAKASGISIRTFRDKIKILQETGHVKIIPPDTYVQGGGSTACMYAPHYPEGYGYVYTIDDAKSLERYNKYIEKRKTQSSEPEIVEKVKAPYKDMDF